MGPRRRSGEERGEGPARLMFEGRDVVAELKETWRITRLSAWRAVIEFYEADDLTYAASIGYYALLSMFPFALITVSILGSVTADDVTRQKVLLFVLRYFPGQFDFIIAQLDAFRQNPIRLGIGGAVLLVWGALGVFGAISTAVNHAWGVEKTRSFWSHRLFSFLMLLTAGLMLMIGLLGRDGGADYRRPLVCRRVAELSGAAGDAGLHDPQRPAAAAGARVRADLLLRAERESARQGRLAWRADHRLVVGRRLQGIRVVRPRRLAVHAASTDRLRP